jgi:DNA polymerase I
MSEHLCLIDGSNLLHRAWAMGTPRRRERDGAEVGATWLFTQMVGKLLRRMSEGRVPPTHLAVFFDPAREKSWRREIFPDYKAHRSEPEPDLVSQIALMQQFCADIGLGAATADRHEADDLIGAYTSDAAVRGWRVTIISSDKDLMQLVQPGVMQVNTMSDRWFNEAIVTEKFDVPPSQLRDYLAMAGDAADGVPGARGIGPKTAARLLKQFGNLDAILENTDQIASMSERAKIVASIEALRLSKILVSLDVDGAPRPLSDEQTRLSRQTTWHEIIDDWRQKNLI